MLEARMIGVLEDRVKRLHLPLNLKLWNGRTIRGGDREPALELTVRSPQALMSLANPSLGQLARSYVEGDLDIEGDIRQTMKVGEELVSGDSSNLQPALHDLEMVAPYQTGRPQVHPAPLRRRQ